MGELLIFIHNLETGFLLQVLAIIRSTLLIMVNWKKKTTQLLEICYTRVSYDK